MDLKNFLFAGYKGYVIKNILKLQKESEFFKFKISGKTAKFQ